jgi:hypothetical protein
MRIRFTVLGVELWCLRLDRAGEVVAEESECDTEESCDSAPSIGGGSTHDFERDSEPNMPEHRYSPYERERPFGFGLRPG